MPSDLDVVFGHLDDQRSTYIARLLDYVRQPTLKFGSRGVVSFELRARHAKRDVHSGNFGGVVPNPIWTLVHLLATMKDPAGQITIDGFHDDIVPPSPEELDAAARLPLDLDAFKRSLGLDRLDAPANRPF